MIRLSEIVGRILGRRATRTDIGYSPGEVMARIEARVDEVLARDMQAILGDVDRALGDISRQLDQPQVQPVLPVKRVRHLHIVRDGDTE